MKTALAKFIRVVRKTERIRDLINEGKARTWVSECEHALLTLANRQRVIVKGGRDGIDFISRSDTLLVEVEGHEMQVRRIMGHTHPRVTGPSDHDLKVLSLLWQKRSYIFEVGGESVGTRIFPKG